MHRINTSTAVPDANGAGKAGFRDGNLAIGQQATALNALFFNAVQEELANVVEAAGLVLNVGQKNQVLAAIQALVTARFTGSNQQLNMNPWQKLPGGVILQWGEALLPASGTSVAQTTIVYPISFPSAVAGPFAIPYEGINSAMGHVPIMRTGVRTTASFQLVGDSNGGQVFDKTCRCGWLSIGF